MNDKRTANTSGLDKARAEGLNSRKGKLNKSTASIKAMIEESLRVVGGADYFARQAEENPSAYMQLIGKILPKNLELNVTSEPHESILKIALIKENE